MPRFYPALRSALLVVATLAASAAQADVGIVGVTWVSPPELQNFAQKPGVSRQAPGEHRWLSKRLGFQRGTPIGASMCEFNERASVPISAHRRLSNGETAVFIEEIALDRARCERIIQYGEIQLRSPRG